MFCVLDSVSSCWCADFCVVLCVYVDKTRTWLKLKVLNSSQEKGQSSLQQRQIIIYYSLHRTVTWTCNLGQIIAGLKEKNKLSPIQPDREIYFQLAYVIKHPLLIFNSENLYFKNEALALSHSILPVTLWL